MANKARGDLLEASRNRIEKSLSRLAQVARTKNEELKLAKSASEERHLLSDRVNELETENLRLHDQVASLAIGVDNLVESGQLELERKIESMKADHVNLDRNFMLLKEQYSILQEENEALGLNSAPIGDGEIVVKLADADAKISALEQDITSKTSELREARNKNSELERALGTLKATVNADERTKTDMQEKLDSTIAYVEELLEA